MADMAWTIGEVSIATRDGRVIRTCLVRNGLGLDERGPKAGEPQWALSHLASGLQVGMLDGCLHDILPVATELADCFNWSLPSTAITKEAAAKVLEIGSRYAGIYYRQSSDYSTVGVQ